MRLRLRGRCSQQTRHQVALREFVGRPTAPEVIIAGIVLEVGIGPTVHQGADLNSVPIVISDACGGGTAKDKDRVLAEFAGTGEVITTDSQTLLPAL